MMGDDLQRSAGSDGGLDEDGLLTTDEMEAIAASKEAESEEEPTRWQRLWTRISHVYRTRMRTTTLVLVIAFFGSVLLYGYTTSYYGVAPTTSNQQRQQQNEQRWVPESTPAPSSTSRTPESTTSETTETSTPSSTSPSRSGPLDFLFPQNQDATESPTPGGETTAPTTSVPAR